MPQDKSKNDQPYSTTPEGLYPRYLAAKQGIDDRALNRQVWETLRQTLAQATGRGPLTILEIGAGIGTMLERAVDWGLVTGPATYLLTDKARDHLLAARRHLAEWAGQRGYALSWSGERRGLLRTASAEVSLLLTAASVEELAGRADPQGPFHLLIAHAVLDLVDFPSLLPGLLAQLADNGLAYLTCNFDGDTVFLPEYPGTAEREIIRRYHASMEARLSGASHTGRRLLTSLPGLGMEILAAGSSDWVVYPQRASYSRDESFFLHAIIATVAQELGSKIGSSPSGLAAWASARHRQIEAGELSFLARHLDLLACRLPTRP
jgi:hypothetical protein